MLFQVEKIKDLAKNVIDLSVVWIWGVQKFLDFFYVYDVSLNVRLPRVKTGIEKDKQNYHTMSWQSTLWIVTVIVQGAFCGFDLRWFSRQCR